MADPVRVFISYSSKDRPIVKRLMEDLKQAGVEVWFDHEKLKPGTRNWTAAVRSGIEQATDVVYAASPDAADSEYVGHELAIARDDGKEDHILPLWIRGEKWSRCVPFGYYYAQYIDARDAAYASGLKELINALDILPNARKAAKVPVIVQINNLVQIVSGIWFDSARNQVSVNGRNVRLTPTESRILQVLAANRGQVCTLNQIVSHAWGYGDESDSYLIKAHIRHLREKIEKEPSKPRYIITAPGEVGYMLSPYDSAIDPD